MVKPEPSLVRQFEEVMSPSGADEEIRDLTAEEIEIIRRRRVLRQAQVTDAPAPAGYKRLSFQTCWQHPFLGRCPINK
jgi:hypothetical protein